MAINLEMLALELRSTLGKMELALGAVADATVWINRAGNIQWCNRSFDELMGCRHIEVLGKPLLELLPLRRKDTLLSPDEHPAKLAFGNKGSATERYHFQGKDRLYMLDISRIPISFGLEEVNAILVIHDITEHDRAEQKIIQLNNSLQDNAAKLEAANKELEAFCYSVSHDLRAPLRHIHGFVEILKRQIDVGVTRNEQTHQTLQIISEAAKQMGRLIDDLLSLSRVGRAALHISRVNTQELVANTVKDLEQETKDRIIFWKIDPLPEVQADPSLLRLVFFNLIANAVKYTSRRAEASIHIGHRSDTPHEVIFFIQDNGAGFDMKYAHKLFGVFQRLHSSDEFEGTGIGLANVQRILSRHGGRAWAEGAIDQGATFYFTLPTQQIVSDSTMTTGNSTNPLPAKSNN